MDIKKHKNWAQDYDEQEDEVYAEKLRSAIIYEEKQLSEVHKNKKLPLLEKIISEYKKLEQNGSDYDEKDYISICAEYDQILKELNYSHIQDTEEEYGIPGDREIEETHSSKIKIKNERDKNER